MHRRHLIVQVWLCEHTLLGGDSLDLGHQGSIDERAEVEGTDVVDKAELESSKVEAGEVEGVEDTELTELEEHLQLLELEDGVDVKDVGGEERLKSQSVEVVLDGELLEQAQVEGIDDVEVAQVKGVEAEAVELGSVEDTALLSSGGGSGEGGESASDHGGETHFDYGIKEHSSSSGKGIERSGSEQ